MKASPPAAASNALELTSGRSLPSGCLAATGSDKTGRVAINVTVGDQRRSVEETGKWVRRNDQQ
jgi:hypothetical protein